MKTIWKSSNGNVEVRQYLDHNGQETGDYELIIWKNKLLALGPQTEENIKNNTKLYKVAKELVHFYGKGSRRSKIGTMRIVDKKFKDWIVSAEGTPELNAARRTYLEGMRAGLTAVNYNRERKN